MKVTAQTTGTFWFMAIGLLFLNFTIVISWMLKTGDQRIALWLFPLVVAAWLLWQYRARPGIVRYVALVPIVVMLLTGLFGRWGTWL